jgi:hypothetical protein
VPFDVFKENESRLANGNSICDPRPEVARIVPSGSLSGGAEWLARVAARDDVHQSVKLLPREGS